MVAMGEAAERDMLDKSLKDLKLSSAEVGKFEKAFKDPEFIKLFAEYAKEVSDPKAKEETEQYLRQLEAQGRAEEVYGKGVQLIVPDEAFVIKTKLAGASGAKVFINVCTSDKVAKLSIRDATGPDGRRGKHVDIPLSLGHKRAGKDKKDEPCSVYDFVVHPDTVTFAQGNPAAMKTLAETAIEHVEQKDNEKLVRAYKVLRAKFKATEGCTQPSVLSIRTADGGQVVNGRLKPSGTAPGEPGMPQSATAGANDDPDGAASGTASSSSGSGSGGARSSFAFPKAKGGQGAAAATSTNTPLVPGQAGYRHPGGEVTPAWELLHRGVLDMAAAWGDAGRGLHVDSTYPKDLLVRVSLPDISSVASVELDVSAKSLRLQVPRRYRLEVTLPFQVDDSNGTAKFDKAKKQLEVTLPVKPPAPPPRPAAAIAAAPPAIQELPPRGESCAPEEPAQQQHSGRQPEARAHHAGQGGAASCAAGASSTGLSLVPPMDTAGGTGTGEEHVISPTEEGPEGSQPAAPAVPQPQAGTVQRELTENERRWKEMHGGANGEAAAADGGDAAGTEGACCGCEGAAAAPASVVAHVAMPAPTALLKPRLNHSLVDELD